MTLSVGGLGGIIYLPAAIAHHGGYFEEEGIQVTVVDTKGGADAAKALIGGSADFAAMSVEHALKAKAQGTDLVVVAGFTRLSGLSLIVDSRYAHRVRKVEDLKGMRVGVSSLGSGTHMALQALLEKVGMKPSDVEVVSVGTTTMAPAMEVGSIQAAMHFDPFAMHLVMQNKAYILFDLATEKDTLWLYGTEYPFTGLVTRREVLEQKPELVQRMVNAIMRAHRFIAESDLESIAAVLPAEYRANESVYMKSLEHSKPTLAPTGQLTPESLEAVVQALKRSGTLPADAQIDVASVLEMSFVKKVQAAMAD
ncbi:MAG: ABC transporter substrate-binding protein [Bacillota bacterium]